jgi:hypothetical protein
MKEGASNYRDLCVETVVATLICICVGAIAYGWNVFNIYNHKFVFVADGLVGSFVFYSLRRLRVRDTIIFVCIPFVMQVVLLTRTTGAMRIFLEFVFFAAVPLGCAILFWSYRKQTSEVRLCDPFILGAFSATLVSVARGVYYATMVMNPESSASLPAIPFSFSETFESFLIGFGIGLGLWILDRSEAKRALHLTKGFAERAA